MEEIKAYSRLMSGFVKSNVSGVARVGRTWFSTKNERKGKNMQKFIVRFTNTVVHN